MKPHLAISKTAAKDLKKILNTDVFVALSQKYMQEKGRDTYNSRCSQNEMCDIQTPSTIDTTLRRRGSAISKSKRPQSKSKPKLKPSSIINLGPAKIQNTVTKWYGQNNQDNSESVKNQSIGPANTSNRKILTDRAVYYGNAQLPYLHSSDAISSLYQRSKVNEKSLIQPLINPSANISPSLLTNLKNLYLYYTSLDSLRQLGTGWSNLKSLTVMCSYMLKDLSGLSIFPSLQYLFVAHNNINQISDIMYHSSLRCVDLQDNKIDLIDQVQYLYTITNLEWVDLAKNPIVKQKQKFRIICENLGNKLQIQDSDKVLEYQLSQIDLDYEAYSYANIQTSNNLIKEINQQILGENIKIGDVWRAAFEKKNNQNGQQHSNYSDLQIITPYEDDSQGQQDLQASHCSRRNEGLRLRVTPLIQYIQNVMSLDPLKKYFNNKVCPQAKFDKPEKNQKQKPQKKTLIRLEGQCQQSHKNQSQIRTHKFAATQKFRMPANAVSQDKPRLNSVSLKKKLGKLSLSKNVNFASTAAPVFSSMKPKQQFAQQFSNTSIGMKFLAKRKLLSKASEQYVK